MTTLENILQDIENGVYGTKGVEKVHMIMRGDEGYVPIHWCLDIIKKHLACEKNAETERQSQDNDGWIPCSERMPENSKVKGVFCPKYNIMTDYGVTEGWYNPNQNGWYALFWFMTGRFLESEIDLKKGDVPKVVFIPDEGKVNVIAWRPLPESYKPPVESADSKRMREREEFFKDGEQI